MTCFCSKLELLGGGPGKGARAGIRRYALSVQELLGNGSMSETEEIDPFSSNWYLVVVQGTDLGRVYPIHEGNNLIGRWDPDCGAFPEVDLEQEDPDSKISRKHAVIDCRGSRVFVEDLGSLNGTFLNDNKLESGQEVEINCGDEITLGNTCLKIEAQKLAS